MNHLDIALAARAHQAGRALRSSSLRHRRLVADPLAVVIWQLGAEPFSAAAIAWGSRPDRFTLAVAGEPRNRDLAFAATLKFARWFNVRFEAHAAQREDVTKGTYSFSRAQTAPQVLVANAATAAMLDRLGRRLAYLTAAGGIQPDPELVKLGKHLLFLSDHWPTAGQQQMLALTDLLNSHWATPQSPTERQSLPALDAYIEPRAGLHGFFSAAKAEQTPAGPVPAVRDDERLDPLVDEFNARRLGSTDPTIVGPLLAPMENHYRELTRPVWELIWRCRDRELAYSEAPSVGRRWDEDRRAYTTHMDWMAVGGLRRTRHTPRRAAVTLRTLEDAQQRTEAEETLDDPLRMIPYLLDNKAVRGRVIRVNRDYKEIAVKRLVKRPLVELLSADPCCMPRGKELFWTEKPDSVEFVVHAIERSAVGFKVTLKLMT
ncbi:MAG: hypothetical protein L0Y70_06340, partial [Gemmataceae bacterium]|nr:hypothetical protein [Gemmataceae bacterium]